MNSDESFPPTSESAAPVVRSICLNLTEQAFQELESVARKTTRTVPEVLRLGLGLVKVGLEEQERGNKLVVADKDLRPIREIVLPL